MTTQSDELVVVKDDMHLKTAMGDLIVTPGHLSLSYAKTNNWIIVPMESALHFDDDDARRISLAASKINIQTCFAVPTENLASTESFTMVLNEQALSAFSTRCSLFNYILFPREMSFAILCTVDDYFLVAGSELFVTDATGMSVKEAKANFQGFANDEEWSDSTREFLVDVANMYK